MSKYQALIDALEAGPTEGPFTVVKEEEAIGSYDIKTPEGYFVATTHGGVMDEVDSRPLADFYAKSNPATIRALLADLERAEKALKLLLSSGGVVADATDQELEAAIQDPDAEEIVQAQAAAVLNARAALAQMAGG